MSFSEKAEEMGGNVGTEVAIAVVSPILLGVTMVENALSHGEKFPVTSSLLVTTAKIGDAVGRFAVKEGPRIVASAVIGDLIDVTLLLPCQNDNGCA